jgi:hypothetical protein
MSSQARAGPQPGKDGDSFTRPSRMIRPPGVGWRGMNRRSLGATGPWLSPIGLGRMGMSDLYGPARNAESLATIHAALDAGITLLDTADFYGAGHNELLLRQALRGCTRQQVVLSVKFGRCAIRPVGGSAWTAPRSRAEFPRLFAAPAGHGLHLRLSAGRSGSGSVGRGHGGRPRGVSSAATGTNRLGAVTRFGYRAADRGAAGDRYPTPQMAPLDSEPSRPA